MANNTPFAANSKTVLVSATTSATASAALPALGNTVRITNEGPNNAYIAIGASSQTAVLPSATPSNSATPIMSGEDVILTIPSDVIQNISAICRTGTASLNVQVGEGT